MTKAMQELLEAATRLSPGEREELAELLLETVETDVGADESWAQAADQRWQAHLKSGDATIDALDAVADARRQLRN